MEIPIPISSNMIYSRRQPAAFSFSANCPAETNRQPPTTHRWSGRPHSAVSRPNYQPLTTLVTLCGEKMNNSQPHSSSIYDQFLASSRKTRAHPEIPQKEPSITNIESFLSVLHDQILAGTLTPPLSGMDEPLQKLFAKHMNYESVQRIWDEAINEILREEDPRDPTTLET